MVAALHRVPGAWVIRELDNAAALHDFFKDQQPGFLVISQDLFDQSSGLFLARPSLLDRTILLTDQASPAGNAYASIYTSAGREEIISKIREVLETGRGSEAETDATVLTPREQTILRMVAMGNTNSSRSRLTRAQHNPSTRIVSPCDWHPAPAAGSR